MTCFSMCEFTPSCVPTSTNCRILLNAKRCEKGAEEQGLMFEARAVHFPLGQRKMESKTESQGTYCMQQRILSRWRTFPLKNPLKQALVW